MNRATDAPAAPLDGEHNGFDAPNHTQVPNKFFDEIMPQISDMSEMKVALALFRLTLGWQGRGRALMQFRLKDLTACTDLKRPAIHRGLTSAMKRGYVHRLRVGTERGKPSYAYGLRIGKAAPEVVVYNITDFKKFNKVDDAPKMRGTVQLDKQTGERLFIIKDSTVHSGEQSGDVSYKKKKSKHTPLPPEGESGVFTERKRARRQGRQASTSAPSSPSDNLPLRELYPSASAFLTDERSAAFARLAPGFDAVEVTAAWLNRYADATLAPGEVEARWRRFVESWFVNRKDQPRYAAAIKAAREAQAAAAMTATEKKEREVWSYAESLLRSLPDLIYKPADLAAGLEEYRRLCAAHPEIKGRLVEAFEQLRRLRFDCKLPALDPSTHPNEIPVSEWDRERVCQHVSMLAYRLRTPPRGSLTEAERRLRDERISEYDAIRLAFPEMSLPPLDVEVRRDAA